MLSNHDSVARSCNTSNFPIADSTTEKHLLSRYIRHLNTLPISIIHLMPMYGANNEHSAVRAYGISIVAIIARSIWL